MVRNSAFVFIKPHAVTDKVKELVKETFEKKGVSIKKEGSLEAEEIDKKMLIDNHYYSIAAKATLLTPDKLNIPKEKFKDKFGVEFDEVLKEGKALNAKDACEKFGIDSDALDKMWGGAKKAGNDIKFGGGFYCAKLEPEGKGEFYVFNGFFMSMRSKFVSPGVSIYYYIVEWESAELSWEDFRGKVLGPTDPAKAPADSLRGAVLARWKELDLKSEPNTGDNGVHASASPFEGLAERMNWLGHRVERDPFGKALLKAGVSSKTVREWCKDPQVTFGPVPITKSIFDSLEDTDSDYCLALCQMISGNCQPKEPEDVDAEIARLQAELEKYRPLGDAVQAIKSFIPSSLPKGFGKGGKDTKGSKGKGKGKYVEDDDDEDKPPMRKKKGKGKGKGKGKRD